jgi:hypothetical protein
MLEVPVLAAPLTEPVALETSEETTVLPLFLEGTEGVAPPIGIVVLTPGG